MCFVSQMLPAKHILLNGFSFFPPSFLRIPRAAPSAQHLPEPRGNLWGTHGELQHNTHTHPLAFIPPLLKGKGQQGSGQLHAAGSREEQHRGHPQGKATAGAYSRRSLPCRSPEHGVSLPPYRKAKRNPRVRDPTARPGAEPSSWCSALSCGSAGSFASCAELTWGSAVASGPMAGQTDRQPSQQGQLPPRSPRPWLPNSSALGEGAHLQKKSEIHSKFIKKGNCRVSRGSAGPAAADVSRQLPDVGVGAAPGVSSVPSLYSCPHLPLTRG